MATVRLGRFEVEDYELPRVCMRCGAPATCYRWRRFRWCPGWAIVFIPFALVPYLILSELLTKRMSVRVPCCEEHKKKPLWPTLVTLGTLLGFILVAAGGVVFYDDPGAFAITCLVGVPLFIAWMFGAVIIHTPAIRPIEITEKSITLKGVSEEFIDALDADRRGDRSGEDEDDRRPRRRRRDEDEEEEERPRRRRQEADDDGGYHDPDEKKPRRRPPPDAIEEGDDR